MKKKTKVIQTYGKKKSVVARLRLKKGKGTVTIGGMDVESIPSKMRRRIIKEPIILAEEILGKNFIENLDIDINVQGGGVMGQAYACRTAIGKALLEWTDNEELRKLYNDYDRSLFIDDSRRTESKKPLRKGARARPIKSYR